MRKEIKALIQEILSENAETRTDYPEAVDKVSAFHRGKAHGKDDLAWRLQEILNKHSH